MSKKEDPWTAPEILVLGVTVAALLWMFATAFSSQTVDVIYKIRYVEEIPLGNTDPSDSLFYIVPYRNQWFEAYSLKPLYLRGNITIPLEVDGTYHLRYKDHPSDQSMYVPILIERID